ncbi:MAG: hypothetical protein GEV08_15270 [Acidimicrobiia bacterium]|nr:hypothetical protein [Acidimicrobiia bacterium]
MGVGRGSAWSVVVWSRWRPIVTARSRPRRLAAIRRAAAESSPGAPRVPLLAAAIEIFLAAGDVGSARSAGLACRAASDVEAAAMEFDAARLGFINLGASADLVALERAAQHDCGPRPGGLSPRELEALTLIADGHTNREIAATLIVSGRSRAWTWCPRRSAQQSDARWRRAPMSPSSKATSRRSAALVLGQASRSSSTWSASTT